MVRLFILVLLLHAPFALATVCPGHGEHDVRESSVSADRDCHERKAEAHESHHNTQKATMAHAEKSPDCCSDGCPCVAGVVPMMSSVQPVEILPLASGVFDIGSAGMPSLSPGVPIPPPIS